MVGSFRRPGCRGGVAGRVRIAGSQVFRGRVVEHRLPLNADPLGGTVSIPDEVSEQFFAGTRTDLVRFVLHDAVRVTSGANKNRTGAVVSIFSLEPTTYLIESGAEPWGDFQVAQSDIELTE